MSEHPLFQRRSVSNNLPHFDRRKLKSMTQFGPDEDGFTVFVTSSAARMLQEGTRQYAPREAYGMLMGRAYKDKRGDFTVVSDVVYARRLSSSRSHVALTADELRKLREEAQVAHPTVDFVGWTHSHCEYSEYSSTDLAEQQMWAEEYDVGILTFMDCIMDARDYPWAVAYRGPSSRPLHLSEDPVPPIQENQDIPLASREEPQEKAAKRFLSIQKLAQPLFLLFLVVAIALGIFLGNVLSSRLLSAWPSSLLSTNLLWNCDQSSGQAPLKVTCAGPVGPDMQSWAWDFGDGTIINKSLATHIYVKPGSYAIKLTVVASTGRLNAGSLNVKVTNSTTGSAKGH